MNVLKGTDRESDSGSPVLNQSEDEHLLDTFPRVNISFESTNPELDPQITEIGTLYITNRNIIWLVEDISKGGFSWETKSISLHAVSKDLQVFPRPCLYCHVDGEEVSEIRFIPEDEEKLSSIFDAVSQSAALNPDEDEDDGEGEWICNEEEVEQGAREAQVLNHLESVLHVSPDLAACMAVSGQFDDADEDEPVQDDIL